MNVLAHIRENGINAEIEFPIDDDELQRILKKHYMPTDTTNLFYVKAIDYPNALSVLNFKSVNLDELNYLAKRIVSFYGDELDQFEIAVKRTNAETLKDLINLTFNLDKFTLIKDISNMAKVGREYILNTEGSVPADSEYDEQYAQIGRELLCSGRGIFTDKGLLFVEDKPLEEVYDGQVFPCYSDKPCIAEVELEYNGKTETIFLPDSESAFGKAVNRLGAQYLEDCVCVLEISNPKYNKLYDAFEEVLQRDGINELNSIIKLIDEYELDPDKLAAAIEYTGVKSAEDIVVLMDNLDDLELIEDVSYGDDEAVGRYFVENDSYEEYEISDELCDFFDYAEFGEHMADIRSGEYVSGGFMFYDGDNDISEILDQLGSAGNSMKLGGM